MSPGRTKVSRTERIVRPPFMVAKKLCPSLDSVQRYAMELMVPKRLGREQN